MITNNNWYYFIVSIVSIVQPIPIINNLMMTWQNWLLYSLGQAWKLLARIGWDPRLRHGSPKKMLFLVKFLAKTNGNFEAYRLFKPNENFLKNGHNVLFWFMIEFFVSFYAIMDVIWNWFLEICVEKSSCPIVKNNILWCYQFLDWPCKILLFLNQTFLNHPLKLF